MNLQAIKNKVSNIAGRKLLVLKKYSPEILLVIGVTGTITSTVLACRATLKVDEILDDHKEKVNRIDIALEKVNNGEIDRDQYSEKDHKKDLTVVYTQTVVNFIKLYGPCVTLGAASIACIVGGHGIMKKRNVALMAAYKTVEEGFTAYRKRVREAYGEETDYMFKNDLKSERVVETVTDENGKTKTTKVDKLSTDGAQPSIYSRFFDESSTQWSKTSEYNMMFLHAQQEYFNNVLKARGHVFLNEIYDALGLERSNAGAVVGWVIRNDGCGDNRIDFGVFDGNKPKVRDFVNGLERNILLDFNVDGVIYDLI